MSKEEVTATMEEFLECTAKFGQQFPEISKNFMGLRNSVMEDGALGGKE